MSVLTDIFINHNDIYFDDLVVGIEAVAANLVRRVLTARMGWQRVIRSGTSSSYLVNKDFTNTIPELLSLPLTARLLEEINRELVKEVKSSPHSLAIESIEIIPTQHQAMHGVEAKVVYRSKYGSLEELTLSI